MENNMGESIIVDLDLNEEPLDPPHGSMTQLGSLLEDLETTHGRIEERIRLLEAVTSRAQQRRAWQQGQTPSQTANASAGAGAFSARNEGGLHTSEGSTAVQERTVERGKIGKRDGTYLIAKALGMDTDGNLPGSDGGSFYDCNICLDMARDPIVTCCGHLFCWSCFYQLSYVHSNAKECPVCKGEVTDTSITPIYGNGNDNSNRKSELKESGLKVPPRPHARRVESMRQQLLYRLTSASAIEERIQQFSSMVDSMGERRGLWGFDGAHITAERTNSLASQRTSQVLQGAETEANQRHRSRQISRLLLQGAASFSSLSSALNSAMDSAERLVEDLEAYIHSRHMRIIHQPSPHTDGRDLFTSIAAVIQPDSQTPDTAAEANSTVPLSALSFRRTDLSAAVIDLENPTEDTFVEINSTVPPSSSSSRRRTNAPRVSDMDNGVSREPRRRRLR